MELSFTDNVTSNLLDVLKPSLSKAKEIKFGIAFVKLSGFSLIQNEIDECLKNNGRVEFLIGLDFKITDPKVLRILSKMVNEGLNLKLFCYSDPPFTDTPVYHPKIYLLNTGKKAVVSIGSSNLTGGGLRDNIEVNVIIKADTKEEVVSDIYGVYNRLKFQKNRFEPDLAYIEDYEKIYKIVRKKSREALKEKRTKNKIKDLKEREKILPKPKPTENELFGWQKLVYERLPGGIFKTNDMYANEEEFREAYPQNKFIKAKIRQILQQLRDIGLLKHLSENKWIKV